MAKNRSSSRSPRAFTALKGRFNVAGDVSILVATAFSIGFLHTLLGPDHYVPFVAMARCNRWSAAKTLVITSLCGIGHVLGSVIIGTMGLLVGTALFRIEAFEALRGDGAAWLLIGFGLAYLTWGLVQAVRGISHTHLHSHPDGTVHTHLHQHDSAHCHVHDGVEILEPTTRASQTMTPWILFLIFVFGPCEVLIPLLMYPAAESDLLTIVMVVAAFSVATVGTMLASVMLMVFGLSFLRFPDMHRFSHAISGFAILVCGALVKFGF